MVAGKADLKKAWIIDKPLTMTNMRYDLADISLLLHTQDDKEKFAVLKTVRSKGLTSSDFDNLLSQMTIGTSHDRLNGLIRAARTNDFMWFSWEVDKFKALFAEGQTDNQIAENMGLAKSTVAAKRLKLGLMRRRDLSQTLTQRALEACIEKNLTLDQAAAKFSVSSSTITNHCRRYDLSFNKTGSNHPKAHISSYDRALICALHDMGYCPSHIAKALDIRLRSIETVLFQTPSAEYIDPYQCAYKKVQQLLNGTLKNVGNIYTPAEIDLLKSLPLTEVASLTGRSLNKLKHKKKALLAALIKQGLNDTVISEQMFCSIDEVCKLRQGMARMCRGKRPDEVIRKVLEECIDLRKSKLEAAALLNVTAKTVHKYCRRFGLAFDRAPSNIKHYDWRLVCTLYRMGYTPKEIALAVPVHLSIIKRAVYNSPTAECVDPNKSPYSRVVQLLNGTLKPVIGPYTPAELSILRKHPIEKASELTGRPVQALLHKLALLHSQRQSVTQRPASKRKALPRLYTKQEIELLITSSSVEQVAAATGRSVSALKTKKRQLKALMLVAQTGQKNQVSVGTGKRYCLDDIQPLLQTEEDKAKFAVMTCIYACAVDNIYVDESCLALGLTNAQLTGTVSAICRNMHLWFSWEDDELALQFDQGLSDQQIAQQMGLSARSVIQRRYKLGLKHKHVNPENAAVQLVAHNKQHNNQKILATARTRHSANVANVKLTVEK